MDGEIHHVLTTFRTIVDELVSNIKHAIDHKDFARAARDWKELAALYASQKATPITVVVNTGTEIIRSTLPAEEQQLVHSKTSHAEQGLNEVRNYAQHKGASAAISELMKK